MIKNHVERQYFLDWLRLLGISSVFFFHSIHFFDIDDWSVKNKTTYFWVSDILGFLSIWLMPLMFLISGFSIYYAIKKYKIKQLIIDKVMRLLVPLIVGIFTFSIMQVYIERISHNQFTGSFINFIPHYFNGLYLPGSTGNFAFHGMHLWYLLFLFVFILIFSPLFYWFKRKNGKSVINTIGNILSVPGCLFLFLVPTIILQNIGNNFLVNAGWALIQYLWFFIAGYIIASHDKLQNQIMKTRRISLIITLLLIVLLIVLKKDLDSHPDVLVWFILFSMLGFSMKNLNFSNTTLKQSNQAIMPFYILHQNILLLIGYFVIRWSQPDIIKYLIIVVSSLLVIWALYEGLIKKYNWLRILFGMKKKRIKLGFNFYNKIEV